MSERIHVLAQQLFGKSTVADCDLQEIKNLVQRYPYFAPAQFLLLEKLKEESSPDYAAQLQKAVLYYHNPLEFEYFISSDKFYTANDTAVDEDEVTISTEIEDEALAESNSEDGNINEIEAEMDDTSSKNAATAWGVHISEKEQSDKKESSLEPLNLLEKKLEQIRQQAPFDESKVAGSSDLRALKSELAQQPVTTLTFEPFHTVDYFASQGIKLSQDEAGKDKFGKQLKSFTEWLKTMKRLPAQQGMAHVDVSTEKKVQHLAEDSVHESNVVTEAMAEVWLKQGNTQKAIEVYDKLSLLNPSKMAFFAAKIDQLKSS